MEAQQRTCTKCRLLKPLVEFNRQKRGQFGRMATCRSCMREVNAAWRTRVRGSAIVPEQKICAACRVSKPSSSFSRAPSTKDGLHSYCHSCDTGKKLTTAKEMAKEVNALKEAFPCIDCKKRHPFWVMQFDHLPGSVKKGTISRMIRAGRRESVFEEIKKCELVCANCHATRTYNRLVARCTAGADRICRPLPPRSSERA